MLRQEELTWMIFKNQRFWKTKRLQEISTATLKKSTQKCGNPTTTRIALKVGQAWKCLINVATLKLTISVATLKSSKITATLKFLKSVVTLLKLPQSVALLKSSKNNSNPDFFKKFGNPIKIALKVGQAWKCLKNVATLKFSISVATILKLPQSLASLKVFKNVATLKLSISVATLLNSPQSGASLKMFKKCGNPAEITQKCGNTKLSKKCGPSLYYQNRPKVWQPLNRPKNVRQPWHRPKKDVATQYQTL